MSDPGSRPWAGATPPSGEFANARLGFAEKIDLGSEILWAYARSRWLLARRELPVVVATLRGGRGEASLTCPDDEDFLDDARLLGRRVSRALQRLPWDSRCLVRSCVLVAMLARRGVEGRLVLGVRSEPSFEAHAWVEVAGRPLLDPGPWRDGRLGEY